MLSSASKYLIVFDLDDTLYPELEYFQSGLNVASTMLDPELRDAFVPESGRLIDEEGQRGVRNILTLALGPNCRDVDLIDAMERAYRGHVPSIRLQPGMLGLIEFLYDRAVLAIISDGRHGEQRRKWRVSISTICLPGSSLPTHSGGNSGNPPLDVSKSCSPNCPFRQRDAFISVIIWKRILPPRALSVGGPCISRRRNSCIPTRKEYRPNLPLIRSKNFPPGLVAIRSFDRFWNFILSAGLRRRGGRILGW